MLQSGAVDAETLCERRRTCARGARTPAPHSGRPRKQKLVIRMSDSGFEEDFGSPKTSSPCRRQEHRARDLCTWYLQYGDVSYEIQRKREAQFHPCTSLARQPQLTAETRCRLVSWLVPLHRHLDLSFECSCLAVSIMDRFLASTPVAADCFQLLGVTALLIASKQVEVGSPPISHLLSFCCDSFTKQQLCSLECLVLMRLNFRLSVPTLAFFLEYYTNNMEAARHAPDAGTVARCSQLAQSVCELSMADYTFTRYPPSVTAHCALSLARELLEKRSERSVHGDIRIQDEDSGSFMDEGASEAGGDSSRRLAEECRENLKLLVSLNAAALDLK